MGKKLNRLLLLMSCNLLLVPAVQAQQVEVSSSLNPVGSGARATGMGGAFIAVADDATAASWNPAGLVQLERPELSFVYGYFKREHSYSSANHPELSKDQSVDLNDVNYASFAYPFHALNKNMIVSLNYQRMYEMDKTVATPFNQAIGAIGSLDSTVNFKQEGYLSTLTPAFAVQVTPGLYLGAAVNVWDDFMGTNSWKSVIMSSGTQTLLGVTTPFTFREEEKFTFSGVNYTFGAMSNLGDVTLGAVLKTPFSADVDHEAVTEQTGPNVVNGLSSSKDQIDMNLPMSYGLGVSYRFSDTFTVAADVYRTHWSDYTIEKDESNGLGGTTRVESNPLSGRPISEGRLKDTTQVKLGAEYLIIKGKTVIPVRGGVFYDPEPGYRATVDGNGNLVTEMKIDNYYGFAVGSGVTLDAWSFDVSYQLRKGNNVSSEVVEPGFSSSVLQHSLSGSLIYRF